MIPSVEVLIIALVVIAILWQANKYSKSLDKAQLTHMREVLADLTTKYNDTPKHMVHERAQLEMSIELAKGRIATLSKIIASH